MTFEPQFTKKIVTDQGFTEVSLPENWLNRIIDEFSEDTHLIQKMSEYIALVRTPGATLSAEADIRLRQEIFPIFRKKIALEYPQYRAFVSDIGEEMFQRLEKDND